MTRTVDYLKNHEQRSKQDREDLGTRRRHHHRPRPEHGSHLDRHRRPERQTHRQGVLVSRATAWVKAQLTAGNLVEDSTGCVQKLLSAARELDQNLAAVAADDAW